MRHGRRWSVSPGEYGDPLPPRLSQAAPPIWELLLSSSLLLLRLSVPDFYYMAALGTHNYSLSTPLICICITINQCTIA